MKITLTVLSILSLLAAVSAVASDDVRVSETCDKYSCVINITGPDNSCVRAARLRSWSSGLEAAVRIRNCMDRVVLAGGGK